MILVDLQAETRLVQTLEAIKNDPGIRRCLWLNLSSVSDVSPTVIKTIIADIIRSFPNDDCQLFRLFTNDIVIIGDALTHEQRETVHNALCSSLKRELPKQIVELYELSLNWGAVAIQAEQTLEKKRFLAVEKKHVAAERARQDILNMKFSPSTLQHMRDIRNIREKLEIMVVEDDVFSRQMVCNSLRKHYTVHIAGDGKNALTNYVSKAPDVIFLDIELPDITGHDVLRKILSIDPEAYIVMLSGNGDKENIMKAMEAGAKGFVAKPFSKEKLLQYIQRSPACLKQPA